MTDRFYSLEMTSQQSQDTTLSAFNNVSKGPKLLLLIHLYGVVGTEKPQIPKIIKQTAKNVQYVANILVTYVKSAY